MRDPRTHPVAGDIFLDPAGSGNCVLVVTRADAHRVDFETYTRHHPGAGGYGCGRFDFVLRIAPELHVAYAVPPTRNDEPH